MSQVPAGWLNDPYGRYQQRYWDGSDWTGHVVTNGEQTVDPMGEQPGHPVRHPAPRRIDRARARGQPSPPSRGKGGSLDALGD